MLLHCTIAVEPALPLPQLVMYRLPDEVILEFKEISDEIIEESLSDETTRRIHASFKEFLDEVSNYHSIAEDAFIEARSNSD